MKINWTPVFTGMTSIGQFRHSCGSRNLGVYLRVRIGFQRRIFHPELWRGGKHGVKKKRKGLDLKRNP